MTDADLDSCVRCHKSRHDRVCDTMAISIAQYESIAAGPLRPPRIWASPGLFSTRASLWVCACKVVLGFRSLWLAIRETHCSTLKQENSLTLVASDFNEIANSAGSSTHCTENVGLPKHRHVAF